ncbi:sensor histidine kinase [Telmatocola sphagniphila]
MWDSLPQLPNEEIANLDREGLIARLRDQSELLKSLTTELAETNQGVVALYAELEDRAEQLRAASDLKSRFLSYMSHEFRTPLGAILSIARILLDRMDGPLTDEQEKQVSFIKSSATELTDMVNDLLDLAKVEAGRIAISPAWFEMVDLFAALRGMFKPILFKADVSLIFEEPHEISRIYTDDVKLSQILRNFISNALKFTNQGEVRVITRPVENDCVEFQVADSGIGISAENLSAIFHDWVQLDSPMQKRLRGSGLGLSLSKRFAEMLGGRVGVTSKLGVGSVFSVIIPRCLPGHQTEGTMSSLEPRGGT